MDIVANFLQLSKYAPYAQEIQIRFDFVQLNASIGNVKIGSKKNKQY